MHRKPGRAPRAHPAIVRLTHWISAAAMVCMIMSGWRIYNASPILPFTFPEWATIGGWLGGALNWHFAAMWALAAAGAIYLVYGFGSGHFRRDIRPVGPRAILRDIVAALTLRLAHREGHYNAVQRLLYSGVLVVIVLTVITGLSIWKPVQLGFLSWIFGGYAVARVIHFTMMVLIVCFIVVHLALVALVPSTLRSMITGGRVAEPIDRETAS
ncbi:cytochrome b/b6 domain-containing protein [Lichenicola cladoniae]|uniref:Cytochrome b/b6 domain-containing protein n=2 Tax=Lichenicola cladoniae TaxID=1484109 RepID=A0A6M8HW55_9PROT|nr:cytochrome b/b6 domain-containing protein [Lichenicola cladoniae]NPD67710.1 cytochrome b/b6 domain-containing protein [Acetobacteraceae bacterium]QKE92773.1 cytochrome b/b6 domain-containing protein [Lichenicola cladoniae]